MIAIYSKMKIVILIAIVTGVSPEDNENDTSNVIDIARIKLTFNMCT